MIWKIAIEIVNMRGISVIETLSDKCIHLWDEKCTHPYGDKCLEKECPIKRCNLK